MAPRRSQQQIIGDEGEVAFCAALPKAWLPRKETPDYGVDFDVEIVNPDGTFPGMRFYAQVKSTASTKPATIRRLSIELEWLEYYRSLSQPVLLVRHSTDTGDLYGRWAHGVHLHNAAGEPPKVPVRFEDSHLFTDTTPAHLVRDVSEYQYWKRDVPNLPLGVVISAQDDALRATRLARALRNAPNRPHDLLEFRTGPKRIGDLTAMLFDDKLVLSAGEVASSTLHFNGPPESADSAWLIESTRTSLAVVFDSLKREELAVRILGNSHRFPLINHNPDMAHRVSEILWKNGDWREAEAVWKRVAYAEDGSVTSDESMLNSVFAVIGAFFHVGFALSQDAASSFLSEITNYASAQDQLGRSEIAGDVYSGVALAHFNLGAFRKAYKAMSKARRLNPSLDQDLSFRRDVAATLFELGRYRSAEALYSSLFSETQSAAILCRRADVQLFAGKYHESAETFAAAYEHAVAEQQAFESLWMLRHLIAENAHAITERQARNPVASAAALEEGRTTKAIELDAISSAAWSTVASQQIEEGDAESALVSYAISAGVDSTRLLDAAVAVGLGLQIGLADQPMYEMITLVVLDIGIHRHGVNRFVDAVEDQIEKISSDIEEHRQLTDELRRVLSETGGEGSTSRWIEGGRLFFVPESDTAD